VSGKNAVVFSVRGVNPGDKKRTKKVSIRKRKGGGVKQRGNDAAMSPGGKSLRSRHPKRLKKTKGAKSQHHKIEENQEKP